MYLAVHSLEAIMAHAVCDCKIGGLQSEIVTADLCHGGLANFYKRSFAFHQKERGACTGQNHDVRTFGEVIVTHAGLDSKQGFRVTVVRNEQVDKMLPDPLFGRQYDEFFTYNVEDIWFPVYVLNFVFKRGKI